MTLSLDSYADALSDLCVGERPEGSIAIHGASTDSRKIRPGWLFCAVPGAREDGGEYITDAIARGAVAIVSEGDVTVPAGVPAFRVRDAYAAAGRIAEVRFGFPGKQLRMVGVTGTNGKTTCAYLLRAMLNRGEGVTGMIGTVEYDLGGCIRQADRTTPPPFLFQELLREMLDQGVRTAVIEVSSHALAQRRMGNVRLAGGLFTNLTRDHLDYHHTFEEYYAAKRRLFTEYLGPRAVAAVNADDFYGLRLARELSGAEGVDVRAFGESDAAAYRICGLRATVDGCTFRITTEGRTVSLQSPMIGHHNASNIAGCAALALGLGVDERDVVAAVRGFAGAPGRLQPIRSGGITVFVDYAHTDDALANVLQALRGIGAQRVLLVFGCGGDRDRTKRPVMGRVAAELADEVFLTSDNPRREDPEAILDDIESGLPSGHGHRRIADRGEAIREAVAAAQPGDVVLVAGKGHEDYQEVGTERFPFSDVLEVRSALTCARTPGPACGGNGGSARS